MGCRPTVEATEKISLEIEARGVKWELIPSVGQLEFASFPVKGRIIDPNVHGLLDGPCDDVHLPVHYGETVHFDWMPRGITRVIEGGRGPEMFFILLSKVLADSHMYSSSQSIWAHLYL